MDQIKKNKEILKKCKESLSPHLFKNICPEVPNWDHFINHLDFEYHNKKAAFVANNPHRERFIRGVLFKNPLYINITNPTKEMYPHIDLFFNTFNQLIPYKGTALASYVNFSKEESSNPHSDKKDHLYWQCIGSTRWKFYDNDYNLIEEFKVNPGDVIYIPANLIHDVISEGPRAAIQFKYNTPDTGFSFD